MVTAKGEIVLHLSSQHKLCVLQRPVVQQPVQFRPLCWLAWAVLHTLLKRSSREGTPDLNLLFQYNMPVRALAQMTGGMVGQETVDGIVMEAKGFWIIGLLRALIGFGQNAVSNRKFRAALDAERGGPAV